MTQKARAFLEFLSKDQALRERAAAAREVPELLKLAKEQGFELSAEDLAPPAGGELNEDELAAVSGAGICACVAGGGGTQQGDNHTCACVLAGFGILGSSYKKDKIRCSCFVGGVGDVF